MALSPLCLSIEACDEQTATIFAQRASRDRRQRSSTFMTLTFALSPSVVVLDRAAWLCFAAAFLCAVDCAKAPCCFNSFRGSFVVRRGLCAADVAAGAARLRRCAEERRVSASVGADASARIGSKALT